MRNGGNLRFAPVHFYNWSKLEQLNGGDIKISAYCTAQSAETRRNPFAPVDVSDWSKLEQTGASEGRCRSGIYNTPKGYIYNHNCGSLRTVAWTAAKGVAQCA